MKVGDFVRVKAGVSQWVILGRKIKIVYLYQCGKKCDVVPVDEGYGIAFLDIACLEPWRDDEMWDADVKRWVPRGYGYQAIEPRVRKT